MNKNRILYNFLHYTLDIKADTCYFCAKDNLCKIKEAAISRHSKH